MGKKLLAGRGAGVLGIGRNFRGVYIVDPEKCEPVAGLTGSESMIKKQSFWKHGSFRSGKYEAVASCLLPGVWVGERKF